MDDSGPSQGVLDILDFISHPDYHIFVIHVGTMENELAVLTAIFYRHEVGELRVSHELR
jgi:hypothetical protein